MVADKQVLRSEGEELEALLNELQADQKVKEISGWESGFTNLSRALDGILPGLYLLVGRPGCGKTAFVKQLFDQVAMHNSVPGIFFSFADGKKELRIKTLSRLSGIENRELRRGSAYMLHWYGLPKRVTELEELPPSWEKVKTAAAAARSWLNLTYLVECARETDLDEIEQLVLQTTASASSDRIMVVIDDSQRLGSAQPLTTRLPAVIERLQAFAVRRHLPIVAVWPDLLEETPSLPQAWLNKALSADVILVMERDTERTKKLTEPNQAITVHIVKNRGGETGKLAYDFFPAFSKFRELD